MKLFEFFSVEIADLTEVQNPYRILGLIRGVDIFLFFCIISIVSEFQSDTIQTDKGLMQTDENICLNLGSYLSES